MNPTTTHRRTTRDAVDDESNAMTYPRSQRPHSYARDFVSPSLVYASLALISPFAAVCRTLHRSSARRRRNLLVPQMASMSSSRRGRMFARVRTTVKPRLHVFGLCRPKIQLGFLSFPRPIASIPRDRLGIASIGRAKRSPVCLDTDSGGK